MRQLEVSHKISSIVCQVSRRRMWPCQVGARARDDINMYFVLIIFSVAIYIVIYNTFTVYISSFIRRYLFIHILFDLGSR